MQADKIKNRTDEVFTAIYAYMVGNGISPSMRDIMVLTGIPSTSSVYNHLNKLEERGWISRIPGVPRSIRLTGGKDEEK